MIVNINGGKQVLEQSTLTVSDLLRLNKVESPDMVAVQLNGKFVDRSVFGSISIKDNDELEFLYFLGGGNLK